MTGVLNLYKPRGITSSAAVVACRKILGTKAIGHMGTLDPAGEGVLLLGVGKATRLFDYYLKKDKEYEAEFSFGYETDTLDGDGTVTAQTEVIPDEEAIRAVLPSFLGCQQQIPPQYSAKSVNGVRSYKLAREGKSTCLPACPVQIYALTLVRRTQENTWLFRVHCSSGTYIRSLCRDVAAKCGSLATMTFIRRIRCGNFSADDSVTMEALQEKKESALVSIADALENLPRVELSDELFRPLCNGIKIPYKSDAEEFTLYCRGELFGIAHTVGGYLKIKTYLRENA